MHLRKVMIGFMTTCNFLCLLHNPALYEAIFKATKEAIASSQQYNQTLWHIDAIIAAAVSFYLPFFLPE